MTRRKPRSDCRSHTRGRRTSSAAIDAARKQFAADTAKRATRVWSQMTLEHLVPALPELIGGSADLTGSNGTKTKHHTAVGPGNFGGNYIHYGVREHGMAAAMNGMALHGGIIPYGGTFLVFTDYCRPSIRLSALMRQRVIYVMTHDSIGLGEDGPTHQPVEHLAALRAIPNLQVLRPADAIETAECWMAALAACETPTILALTRQAVPTMLRKSLGEENLSLKGGYVVAEPEGGRDVTLIATGSEVGARGGGGRGARQGGHQGGRRVAAVVRAVPQAKRGLPRRRAGCRAARRHRGRRAAGLGRMAAPQGHLHRALGFRSLGARAESVTSTSGSRRRRWPRPRASSSNPRANTA